jgi:predicted nucleotidyltransferase
MKLTASIEQVLTVADALSQLPEPHAFVGGAIVGLYLTDPAAQPPRHTKDVDVVLEIMTYARFDKLQEKLRGLKFAHDTSPGAPICRWRFKEILVDVMPSNESVLTWKKGWFEQALKHAQDIEVRRGRSLRIVTAPFFLATKFDAFEDRGRKDPIMSPDLEDIVLIVDGRPEIVDEVAAAPADLRKFLHDHCKPLVEDSLLRETVTQLLQPGPIQAERAKVVLERLKRMAPP